MPANFDPAVYLRGGNAGDPARAQLAVRRLRMMVPGLTAFAQALTRNPRVRVVVSPGNPCTDGTNIYLRPPGELGDTDPHQQHLCGKRDENDTPLCLMCRTIEGVETTLYHEIAHIAYDSFEAVSDADKAEIVKRRLAELGTDETTRAGKLAKQLAEQDPQSYLMAAGMVSEFLPLILNAMEDARVNLAMYRARPGTYKMFRGQVVNVLEEGIMQPDGTLVYWRDMPRNLQTVCALYATAAGFEIDGWFADEVVAAMRDPELAATLKRVQTARSAKAIYRIGFTVLEHLRRLGFCKRKNEAEDDEQEQQEVGSKDGDKGERLDNEDATPSGPSMPEDDSPSQPSGTGQPGDSDDSDGDAAEGEQEPAGENPDGADGTGQESDEEDGETGTGDSESDDASEDSDGDQEGGNGSQDDQDGDDEAEGAGSGSDDQEDDQDPEDGAGSGDEDDEPGDEDDEPGDSEDLDGDSAGGWDEDDSDDGESAHNGSGEASEQLRCIECDQPFPKGSDKGQTYNHEHGGPLCNECAAADNEHDSDTEGGYDSGSSVTDPGEIAPKQESGNHETPYTGDPYFGDGSPEEVGDALAQFGGHAEKLPTIEEMEQESAIDKAIIQGEVFDSPSRNILGINIHREGQSVLSGSGYDLSGRMAWNKRYDVNVHNHAPDESPRYPCQACRDSMAYEITPDEGVLAASLGRLRVVFSDNRKARQARNLKRGRINAKVLGRRVPVADERLFQKKSEPGKKDYFVLLAMDNSGSTASGALSVIKRATFHQAELLARMGVKFAVYAQNGSPATYDGSLFSPGSLMNLDIVVVKEAHEPWGPVQKARLMAVGPGGFNLDGHAMEFYRKVLDAQRQTDRVILYYTDGEMPNENYDEELEVLQREIKNCERRGYSVIGIGVGTDSPKRHGLDTIEINEVEDVPLVVRELESRINQKVGAA